MRVFLNREGREIIKKGIDIAANTIKTSLGGAGRTSVIYSGGLVGITKDGITIARNIILEGDLNIGATIIRSSAEKQLEDSGDGTTLVSLLTQKIIEHGFDAISNGMDVIEIKKGIDLAVDLVSKEILKHAQQVGDDNEKIKNIAIISSNNDQTLGTLIADAFSKIGNDGTLFIEESKSYETFVRIDEGFKISSGYTSPLFANQETMEVELIKPYILLYDGKIDKMDKLIPVLTVMKEKGLNMQILIICDNVEGEALKTLIVNRLKGAINVVCVNAPFFGERKTHAMEDIAVITNGTFITLDKGIKDFDFKYWGQAEKILVTKNDTTIIGGKGDKEEVNKRSNQIDVLMEQAETEIEKVFLKQRKSRLNSRMAVIAVGAQSQEEMKEKKDRVEDSVLSVYCSVEQGVVAGGGMALTKSISCLEGLQDVSEKQMVGINIIKECLTAPLWQIMENAGVENKDELIKELIEKDYGFGYNVKTGKIENLLESGVIDPAKVVVTALANAASVASTILTAESLIC